MSRDERDHDDTTEPEGDGPGLVGPFLSPSGTILPIPRALDPGPPKPEPEEGWTLGPGRRSGPPSADDGAARPRSLPIFVWVGVVLWLVVTVASLTAVIQSPADHVGLAVFLVLIWLLLFGLAAMTRLTEWIGKPR